MKTKEIRIIINLLLKYKGKILINAFLSIILLVIYMVTPIIEQKIIDNGLLGENFSYLLGLICISAGLGIFGFVVEYLQLFIQAGVASSFRNFLKIESLAHALRLKMEHIKKHSILALMSDANTDINNMSRICSNDIFGILIEFITVFGYMAGLFLLDWKLTLVVLGVIPLKIIISNFSGKVTKRRMEALLALQKKISRWQSDNYAGIVEIKNWNMYKHIENEFADLSNKREILDRRIYMSTALDSCLKKSSEKIIMVFVYIVAAIQIWNGKLSIGAFIAFIQYAGYLFAPIDVIAGLKVVLGNVLPSVKSYNDFMTLEEENFVAGKQEVMIPQAINFNNITFAYEKQIILRNFSLTLHRGEKTAIVGLNGSGKSTLINLLLRYYTPQKGEILFDEENIERYSLEKYRQCFSIMGQNVFLFNASIENNINMFQEKSIDVKKEYRDILSYVEQLPENYQTIVGFDGAKLSGGEKQRVALVRSLSKKADILILDEATSNCDVEMEHMFKTVLENDVHGYVLCITHNYEIIKAFDRIVVLDAGNIILDGTYEEVSPYLQGMGHTEKRLNNRFRKKYF